MRSSKEDGQRVASQLVKRLPDPNLQAALLDGQTLIEITCVAGVKGGSDWLPLKGTVIVPIELLVGKTYNEINDLIAERVSLDVVELLLLGDTGSEDTYLTTLDGAKKLGAKTAHIEFSNDARVEYKGSSQSKDVPEKHTGLFLTLKFRVQWDAAKNTAAA